MRFVSYMRRSAKILILNKEFMHLRVKENENL